MGVTGLWKLIEPCGEPVPICTLEGKILAVDISIWLHQVVKGFQDNKGSALNNAHLLGLFHRLCKLLYYRVRPIFIFDGCVPQLKRDTIARRQQNRSKLNNEADRIKALLLQSLAKEKVVQQALGTNAELLLKSPVKRPIKAASEIDDLFKLPPQLPAIEEEQSEDESNCNVSFSSNSCAEDYSCSSLNESSFEEGNARHAYNANLQSIDVRSQQFLDLPADIRHEILVDIKETRKQSSWGRLHELPSRGDDFSSFQMKRLLKRRAVQESLEEAEQQMGGTALTFAELSNFFTEEGIITPSTLENVTKQISSDENTRYLLVRDLKKKNLKCESIDESKSENIHSNEEQPTTSSSAAQKQKDELVDRKKSSEYDADLKLAIALSLEETQVYNEKDYDYDGRDLKLNRDQRKQLGNAAKGPARAYMIEYAGMNDEEVEDIMDKTQATEELFDISMNNNKKSPEESGKALKIISNDNSKFILNNLTNKGFDIDTNNRNVNDDKNELELHLTDDSVGSDTDFVDVNEAPSIKSHLEEPLEIVINTNEPLTPKEDLFADIFKDSPMAIKEHAENNVNAKQVSKMEKSVISQKIMKENETKMFNILDELKKQAKDIKNIKLDSIKIDNSIIDLSDDEILPKNLKNNAIKNEIIEICDSDDNHISNIQSKSPNLKTPSKHKKITEYFDKNYFIKRTPDKPVGEEAVTPKVKSPFFIKKTPPKSRSSLKRNGDNEEKTDHSPTKKRSKATKSLFSVEKENTHAHDIIGIDLNIVNTPPKTAEEIINEASETLKEQKNEQELLSLANDLAKQRRELEIERNRQDRMGQSVSQRMSVECQELLRLFGVPYIVAPMEAEAQCAFLNAVELTNGTITDDSDIWLFGGRTVYKNFFAQNKHVLEFRADRIEKSFNCDRNKLIQLACLVGSDYTTGINGIGAVTALEILAAFSHSSPKTDERKSGTTVLTILSTLTKFRDWWQQNKNSSVQTGSSTRLSLRKKLKNIELHEGFPNIAVVEAYLTPKVDESKDLFSWGTPDVESIRDFARKSFGWTTSKTDDILMPVIKKINDKTIQGTIRNYFNVKSTVSVRQLKVSKRVQKAISGMSTVNEQPEKVSPKASRSERRNLKKAKDAATRKLQTKTKKISKTKQ